MARELNYFLKFTDTFTGADGRSSIVHTVYEMSATTGVDAVFTGMPTNNPVESGESFADHYFNENDIVSFNGVITQAWASSILLEADDLGEVYYFSYNTKEFIDGLKKHKESATLFSIHFDGRVVENCVFESLEISKSTSDGFDAWGISFTASSVQIANLATVQVVPDPEFEIQLAEEKEEAKGKQEQTPKIIRRVLKLFNSNKFTGTQAATTRAKAKFAAE